MNINCEAVIESSDNSDDDYIVFILKIMILQVIRQIFCKMLIGGRKFVYTDMFFKVTNIMETFQNDYL